MMKKNKKVSTKKKSLKKDMKQDIPRLDQALIDLWDNEYDERFNDL